MALPSVHTCQACQVLGEVLQNYSLSGFRVDCTSRWPLFLCPVNGIMRIMLYALDQVVYTWSFKVPQKMGTG